MTTFKELFTELDMPPLEKSTSSPSSRDIKIEPPASFTIAPAKNKQAAALAPATEVQKLQDSPLLSGLVQSVMASQDGVEEACENDIDV